MSTDAEKHHISILDGLRGAMAFWVFWGHLQLACIGTITRIGPAALAVDVFMFLSGFLMAYHWILRQKRFSSLKQQAMDFYIRRFFRIAPLYYVLLTVAYLLQDYVFGAKYEMMSLVPPPWADKLGQSAGASLPSVEPLSVLAHYSFVFGFFPKYAANNILPDWSIGLEMQFYLVFPFLVLLIARYKYLGLVIASLVISILIKKVFGLYTKPGLFGLFSQPSLILFKLNFFVCGICIAHGYLKRNKDQVLSVVLVVLGVLSIINAKIQVLGLILFSVYVLFSKSQLVGIINRICETRFVKFWGDTSYAVYLCHMLFLHPCLVFLHQQSWFTSLGPTWRLCASFVLIGIPVYFTSFALFKSVEIGGISLGKKVVVFWAKKKITAK